MNTAQYVMFVSQTNDPHEPVLST